MKEILNAIINNKNVSDELIEDELYEICSSVHASCDDSCPMFKFMYKDEKGFMQCDYFKSGKKMLKKLRENNK